MRLVGGLLLLLLTLGPTTAIAGTCDCDISAAEVAACDALLALDPAAQAATLATHLPWGLPIAPESALGEHLLVQQEYVLTYDDDLRVPLWAAYRLTAADLAVARPRTECFRDDPRLPATAAAFCADYDEPTFDRGHLVPNADMTRSEAAMINTYLFSNMTPQHANFNRIIWSRLEGLVRDWAKTRGVVYVVTGSVFDRDGDGQRDPDEAAESVAPTLRVAIPSAFYKIILAPAADGRIDSLAFLLPHDNQRHTGKDGLHYLEHSLTAIDRIEELTGLDWFPEHAADGTEIGPWQESSVATRLWQTR